MVHQVLSLDCIYTTHIQMTSGVLFFDPVWPVFKTLLFYCAIKGYMSIRVLLAVSLEVFD